VEVSILDIYGRAVVKFKLDKPTRFMYRKDEDGGNICSMALESNSIPNYAMVIF
jgi:hypothetical protein